MNIWLLIAGLVAALAAVGHAVLGERTNIRSLRSSSVPLNERAELHGVWHMASALLALSALVLLLLAGGVPLEAPTLIARAIGTFYLISGAIFTLIVVFSERSLLTRVPAWLLLLAVGVFAWLGSV